MNKNKNAPAVVQPNAPAERQAQPIATLDERIHSAALAIFQRYGKMLGTLIGGDKATADRWMATMKYLFRTTPDLVTKCDSETLGLSIVRAASLGFDLNPLLGQAWIIPRWNSKKRITEAVLQVGYKGALMLMYRGNSVKSASATAVYKGEKWKWIAGTDEKLVHEPDDDKRTNRLDDIVAAYSVVWMRGSDRPVFKVVGRRKLLDAASMSGKDGGIGNVWRDHPEEMAAKTAIILVSKSIPGLDGNRDLSILAEIETQHSIGKDVELPPMETLPTVQQSNVALEALAAAHDHGEPDGGAEVEPNAIDAEAAETDEPQEHEAAKALEEYVPEA